MLYFLSWIATPPADSLAADISSSRESPLRVVVAFLLLESISLSEIVLLFLFFSEVVLWFPPVCWSEKRKEQLTELQQLKKKKLRRLMQFQTHENKCQASPLTFMHLSTALLIVLILLNSRDLTDINADVLPIRRRITHTVILNKYEWLGFW